MAPKTKSKKIHCIRCPAGENEFSRHGLCQCQVEIPREGNDLYRPEDLWPAYAPGPNTLDVSDREVARAVIEAATKDPSVNSKYEGHVITRTMLEEAVKVALPASEAAEEEAARTGKKKGGKSNASTQTPQTAAAAPAGHEPTTSRTDQQPAAASTPSSGPVIVSLRQQNAALAARLRGQAAEQHLGTETLASGSMTTSTHTPAADDANDTATSNTSTATIPYTGFKIDLQQSPKNPALAAIDVHAGRLLQTQQDTDRLNNITKSWNAKLIKNKHGLRTAFAGIKDAEKHDVFVNYLAITYPEKIHVYELAMSRGNDSNNNPILVKKPADRLLVLEELTRNHYANQLGQTQSRWVSDGDLIWSTVPLFHQTDASVVPPPLQTAATGQAIQYINETGIQLDLEEVTITFRQTLALNTPISQLFFDANARNFDDGIPGTLTRGLNLFFTKYVRNRDSHRPDDFTCVGANKSFPNAAGHHLDVGTPELRAMEGFFLSTRPGVESMFLNISTATSPFYENILLSDFIQRIGGHSMRAAHLSRMLKGVKVRIEYETNNTAGTFPHRTSRYRFITGTAPTSFHPPDDIPRTSNQQRPNRTTYPQANSLKHWYAADSPYSRAPEMPRPNLGLSGKEIAINVGKEPPDAHSYKQDRSEWYPATQLRIVQWQPYRGGTLAPSQTSKMIAVALKSPDSHKDLIAGAGTTGDSGKGLRHFGFTGSNAGGNQAGLGMNSMSAGTEFIRVPARFLTAPKLEFTGPGKGKDSTDVHQPYGADWRLMRDKVARRIFKTTPNPKVTFFPVINLTDETLRGVAIDNLRDAFRAHGMAVSQAQMPVHQVSPGDYQAGQGWEQRLADAFAQCQKKYPTNPVFLIVLPDTDPDMYSAVKRVAELRLGMKVVCFTHEKFDRAEAQMASNIALKFNIKFGRDIHHLDQSSMNRLRSGQGLNLKAHTIVLGADVAHPTNGAHKPCPSIASVVGSTDDQFMQYPGSMRLQRSKKEDIVDIAEMVKERLIDWAEKHGRNLPKNMLFYRDGVSESQYDIIRRRELPQLQIAMNLAHRHLNPPRPGQGPPPAPVKPTIPRMQPDDGLSKKDREKAEKVQEEALAEQIESNPNNVKFGLTFMVVGKRHHTRFYTTKPEQRTSDSNHNPRPGLAVDQVITHPLSMDFYLQSHKAIKGTGRSAHYFVLRNNMDLSIEDLQNITHTFCYAYARATKGVSYCAPAYYADRLCDRGRAYLRQWLTHKFGYGPRDQDKAPRAAPESWLHYIEDAKNALHNSAYWRPYVNATPVPPKYGMDRQNPWGANLDNIMFYL